MVVAHTYASTDEAAARYGVHVETLRRLYREGAIPGLKVGRVLRFDLDALDQVFQSNGRLPGARASTVGPDFDALDAP